MFSDSHTLCTLSPSRLCPGQSHFSNPIQLVSFLGRLKWSPGVVCSQRNSRGGIKLGCPESPESWQEVAGGSPSALPLRQALPGLSTLTPQSSPVGGLEQDAPVP